MVKVEKLNKITRARYDKIINRGGEKIYPLIFSAAAPVVENIRKNGNKALVSYIRKFEKVSLKPGELIVKKSEIRNAYKNLPGNLLRDVELMIKNVGMFYKNQLSRTNRGWKKSFGGGYTAGQVLRPIETVGVYVPGGAALYPSTAVMGVVPARIAGVKKIALSTPAGRNKKVADIVLVAADMAGADMIIKAGGMQAIGAMAVGTETIGGVDKIIGPGNVWVSAAKLYVMIRNYASIELTAGPSEVLIIADGGANSDWIARDMMAQSEHDPNSSAILVTTSEKTAGEVRKYLSKAVKESLRRKTIESSLKNYGAILVAGSVRQAIDFANEFAPEHLQIMTKNPGKILESVNNAGSVFLGDYTPTVLGDYISGTNHILPTGGSARYTGGVNLETFFKRPTFQKFTRKSLGCFRKPLVELSKMEGLIEHANSVKVRFSGSKD